MTFDMLSQKGRRVTVECDGIRELVDCERIHYAPEGIVFPDCIVCGAIAIAGWTDDEELWQRSKVRCL